MILCETLWDVMNWGLQALKEPGTLPPEQFVGVIQKMIEALMFYYVKCGPWA